MKMLPVLLITCTLHAQTTRPIQIGDFFRMKRIASPALSPDGRRVVFAVTTPDLAGNTSATDLWLSTVDGKSIRQLTTHSAADRNPAWSPDGMWIAFESTRSGENQIWLLSTSGGEPRQFTTLSTGASQAVWSPDGKQLAFVSEVFPEFSALPFAESDAQNAKRLKELSGGRIKAQIFTRLLYRHWDHYVQGKRRHLFVQALDGGAPRDLTPGDRDAVPTSSTFSGGTDYAFSPDGALIASASFDKTVRIWDASDGHLISIFKGHQEPVDRCQFSPDGMRLLSFSSSPKPELKLWNVSTGEAPASFSGFAGNVYDCAFSPDSKYMATAGGWEASDDPEYSFGQLLIWDLEQGALRTSFRGHTSEIRRTEFSPDGTLLASASSDGAVKLWDTKALPRQDGFSDFTGMPRSSTLSPNGKRTGYAFLERVEVWDTVIGKRSAAFRLQPGYLGGCGFSPDGERIVAATSVGTAKIWRLRDGMEDAVLRVKHWLTSCSFSAGGFSVFLGDGSGNILEWDMQSGAAAPIIDLGYLSGGVERFTVSSDDTLLASVHRDGSLRLWRRVKNEKPVYLLPGDKAAGEAVCCAISPDLRFLLAGYDDGNIRIWDTVGLRELAVLKAHGEVVRACAFSPDGALVATGSIKGHLRIWNAGSLEVLMNDWLEGYPMAFAWLEDKKTLAVAHSAGASILEFQNLSAFL